MERYGSCDDGESGRVGGGLWFWLLTFFSVREAGKVSACYEYAYVGILFSEGSVCLIEYSWDFI